MSGLLDFPNNPLEAEVFSTPKIDFVWRTNKWRRQIKVTPPITFLAMQPNSVVVNTDAGLRVKVHGTGFTVDTKVVWNGVDWMYATFVSASEIEVWNLPAFPIVGVTQVTVREAGFVTPPLPFEVLTDPGLTLTGFDPTSGIQGAPPYKCRFIGTGYRFDSVCSMENATVPSTYISPTEMEVTVTPPPIGTSFIDCKVQNGMTASNVLRMNFIDPGATPTLTLLDPDSLNLNGGNGGPYPVDLYGTHFTDADPPNLKVRIFGNGQDLDAFIEQVFDYGHMRILLVIDALPAGYFYSVTVSVNSIESNALSLYIEWN